jgi:hypothetical protein
LTGTKKSGFITIDKDVDASNKLLAVTGSLILRGKMPSTVYTRLA